MLYFTRYGVKVYKCRKYCSAARRESRDESRFGQCTGDERQFNKLEKKFKFEKKFKWPTRKVRLFGK